MRLVALAVVVMAGIALAGTPSKKLMAGLKKPAVSSSKKAKPLDPQSGRFT